MPDTHETRLTRARLSLEGLSVGDAFGVLHGLRRAPLVSPMWRYTDDTNMALSIYEVLRKHGEIEQDALMESFVAHFDESRGYAFGSHYMIQRVQYGGSWRTLTRELFDGQGSFGNGSAMRVTPVGAYFADDQTALIEHARRSAEVTHSHAEAIAGAIATAAAAAVAWQCREAKPPPRADFIDRILTYIPPDTQVYERTQQARDLPPSTSAGKSVARIGNGDNITCQDTVPFVLWCAGERLSNFEDALWLSAEYSGDRDTTCAMVGGIVVMYTGLDSIPPKWLASREKLPAWALGDNTDA